MKAFEKVTPESVGISSAKLAEIIRQFDKLEFMNGLIMLRHGKQFFEGYWAPYAKENTHALWSLSKSFTSVAIGIAQHEGLLKLTDTIASFFPEFDSAITDERMRKVTLRDLLTMRSGHDNCAYNYMAREIDFGNPGGCGVFARGFLASPLKYEPGTHFVYNTAATYMLSAALQRVAGVSLREYLMPRLFAPMGIVPGIWEESPDGVCLGGIGLYLKTKDIAKFGQMILNHGVWNGMQLVPADYVADATSLQTETDVDNDFPKADNWKNGYGYQFWMSRFGFRADGACGQYAIVLPEYDMVVAINAAMANMGAIMENVLWKLLIPIIQPEPLPEEPAAHQALLKLADELTLPTMPGDITKRGTNRIFEFEQNYAGILSCSVEFGDDECALTFKTAHGIQQLRAGFGSHRISCIRLQDAIAHPIAASAAWDDAGKLQIRALFMDSTFHDFFTIDLNDPVHPITFHSTCILFRTLFPVLRVRHTANIR